MYRQDPLLNCRLHQLRSSTSKKMTFIIGFERSLSSGPELTLTQEMLKMTSIKQSMWKKSSPRRLRQENRCDVVSTLLRQLEAPQLT